MQRKSLAGLAAVPLAFSSPALADEQSWDTASTIARNGLVVAALALPAAQGDWSGAKQAALSLGATKLVVSGLKHTIEAERPDRSNDNSFPSGHTSVSFAAAATLGRRHGWRYGLPAHIVATFVGVARVEAKKHYVEDVIVGAIIGESAGWLLTTPKSASVQFFPWGDTRSAGVYVAMQF
jgi:membrane-associated phospholipid phosphatase